MQKKGLKIAVGSDHAGFEIKVKLRDYLIVNDCEVVDYGTYSSESTDYPDYIHPLCRDMKDKAFDFGIILCGSGNGVNMTANKHTHIRAALCWIPEIARLARLHNDANVLAIPARYVTFETAREMADIFLNTDFEGGRHQIRVSKIAAV